MNRAPACAATGKRGTVGREGKLVLPATSRAEAETPMRPTPPSRGRGQARAPGAGPTRRAAGSTRLARHDQRPTLLGPVLEAIQRLGGYGRRLAGQRGRGRCRRQHRYQPNSSSQTSWWRRSGFIGCVSRGTSGRQHPLHHGGGEQAAAALAPVDGARSSVAACASASRRAAGRSPCHSARTPPIAQ